MSTQTDKQEIRQRILSAREQLPAASRAQFSANIARRIALLPEYQSAQTILAYMNFGAEFESEIFVRQVLADGKTLLLPRVNTATRELDLYRIEDVGAQLVPGAYDIREPAAERCVIQDSLDAIDLILLPGVAFGRKGERLGYGGGFFDKLIARMPHKPVLVAGAFEVQIVADIPMETTDQRIDWLVTERESFACR